MTGLIKGGSFLISKVAPEDIFTPEDFDDLHLMTAKTVRSFVSDKIIPQMDAIEAKEEGVSVGLLKELGKLGLLGSDVSEQYGGESADKITSLVITEEMSRSGSFSLVFGAHVGIGTLPIVFFGNEEQKKRYLPDLVSGKKVAAYALTEPEAGSDALNTKTKAVLSDCGKYYILNGAKQFITNAAWAGVIITYAKIDGEKFTAFIVDRDASGVSIGPEEPKMGIKGSSTCSVIMENAQVPVENVLHEIGQGHKVAFNILNIGRFKLAIGCVGGAKYAIELSAEYALNREQFKMPIATFGLIKGKIADMVIKTYALESMCYRNAGLIENMVKGIDLTAPDAGKKMAEGIHEYAIECSVTKIFGSEVLDFTVDEGVQIHGGYGFSQEYVIERMYRDSRINRIFEGTNEINRMIISATLLKKAMKGEIALIEAATKLQEELLMPMTADIPDEILAAEEYAIENLKKMFLLVSGSAARKYGPDIQKEQEVLARMADMVNEIFAAESMLLRTKKIMVASGEEVAKLSIAMTECYVTELMPRMEVWGKEVFTYMEEGDTRRTLFSILRKLSRFEGVDLYTRKHAIAKAIYAEKRYKVV